MPSEARAMTTRDPTFTPHTQTSTVIVEHEGARTIGRAEATALLREGLTLAHKRLDTALRLAFDTPHTWWQLSMDEPAAVLGAPSRDRELISALRQQRNAFLVRFETVFGEAFQQRVQGNTRAAKRRGSNSYQLSLVDDTDLTGQVALKNVIRGMHDASQDELYALNFRVRLLLREAPDGTPFDNPWGPDYLCDAFGVVCRELWKDLKVWRPIMEQLVRFMTPHVVKLYRDLNGFLQDQDVLPTLRVRLRARAGEAQPQIQGAASLYSTLYQLMNPGASASGFAGTQMTGSFSGGGYGTPSSFDPWGGQASAAGAPQPLPAALRQALDGLQQGDLDALAQAAAHIDAQALKAGSANVLPQIKA